MMFRVAIVQVDKIQQIVQKCIVCGGIVFAVKAIKLQCLNVENAVCVCVVW